MSALPLIDAEIRDIHRLFQAWFRGTMDADALGGGFLARFTSDFAMVSPEQVERDLGTLREALSAAHGALPDIEIDVRNIRGRQVGEQQATVTYEEWQRPDPSQPWRGRLSTACFVQVEGRWCWAWLHESWLPGTGDPTLDPNRFLDSDHPDIVAFAEAHRRDTPKASAVALYYAVRDRIRYSPWRVHFTADRYTGSRVLGLDPNEGGHCIDKALLLATAARALGIPSRLHFANVRNHIGTARLEAELGTDLLVFHGYVELWLEGRWVAATPAFNKELCAQLGVAPLEFDGERDSIFQPFDGDTRFMETVTDHGTYTEIPMTRMLHEWRTHYAPVRKGTWVRR